MLPVVLFVGFVLGAAAASLYFALKGKKTTGRSHSQGPTEAYYPFQRTQGVLDKSELTLLKQLQWAMGDDTFVFAKVNLQCMVDIPKGTERREFYHNLAKTRHADFLLCDVKRVKPVLAILTGKVQDEVTLQILDAASIPVLKLPAGEVYAPSDLKNKIQFAIRSHLDMAHGISEPEIIEGH